MSSSSHKHRSYDAESILELGLSLAWGLTGWWLPKYFLYLATESIVHKDTSDVFQVVNNQVVLDFLLNQDLVDPPTIPSTFLIWTAVWLPLLATLFVITRLPTTDRAASLRTNLCYFSTALGLSEGLTQMLKIYVQRRRPNFIALCGFENGQCTNSEAHIVEANLSFPSGHSSLTACGCTFLTMALANHILATPALSRQIKRWSCVGITILAFGYTCYVGTSRIVDHWHHPSDVVAGWWLGSLSAMIFFHVWYPPLWHLHHVGIPWSVVLRRQDGNNNNSALATAPSSGTLLLLPRTSTVKEESFQE
uniref:Phosphatidic acid phosphatase type 2/haloperoxidase domain-containing protein n=1 Tax=Amphora coffeiformis TaxID=265554 RepID=A0A7S3L3Y1_9STRA